MEIIAFAIYGFALVLLAGAFVARGWTISETRARLRHLESLHATSERHWRSEFEKVAKLAPHQLAATVDDLAGAVEALRSSNRKELSKLWARIGAEMPAAEHQEAQPLTRDALRKQYLRQTLSAPKPNSGE